MKLKRILDLKDLLHLTVVLLLSFRNTMDQEVDILLSTISGEIKKKTKYSYLLLWSREWLLKRGKLSHVNLLSESCHETQDCRNYL